MIFVYHCPGYVKNNLLDIRSSATSKFTGPMALLLDPGFGSVANVADCIRMPYFQSQKCLHICCYDCSRDYYSDSWNYISFFNYVIVTENKIYSFIELNLKVDPES